MDVDKFPEVCCGPPDDDGTTEYGAGGGGGGGRLMDEDGPVMDVVDHEALPIRPTACRM